MPRRIALAAGVAVAVAAAPVGAHRFEFRPLGDTPTTVAVTGSFSGWKPSAHPMARGRDGVFRADVALPAGRHLYKFVVDGTEWTSDPTNPNRESDGYGGWNSVIEGKKRGGGAKRPAPSLAAPAVTIAVAGVPSGFSQPWVPVRYDGGRLVYDARATTAAGLLISTRSFTGPAPRGTGRGATTATLAARPLFVWLPAEYAADPARRFPVIYLHDGQNVWDDPSAGFGHGGWALNLAMQQGNPPLPPAILVGIPNSEARLAEYGTGSPVMRPREIPYLRFLVGVVKPQVDADFRTRPGPADTSVMGSSMGGIISILAGYAYPEVFGNIAALSPAIPMAADSRGNTAFDLLRERGRGKFRLYVDHGTSGTMKDGAPVTRRFAEAARKAGWGRPRDFEYYVDEGAAHNETAWRQRANRPLQFLLAGGRK
jgi:predicted alpha/beta superfamily hydrolase